MSSKLKSPKSPAKTMAGRRVQDTQMRMHSKSHLLTMKNQKLLKQQKRLNKEKQSVEKELAETEATIEKLNKRESEINDSLQKAVSYQAEGLILAEENKFNAFLKTILSEVEEACGKPLERNDLSEEELENLLQQLEDENQRLANDEITLQKNSHIERLNTLVEDITNEVEKHEKEAIEAELNVQKINMKEHEDDIISRHLDDRILSANDRKETAITELTMIDNKKKLAIIRREEARARKEEAENQSDIAKIKEEEISKKEVEFYEESGYRALEEEEEREAELKYSSPKIQRSESVTKRMNDTEHLNSFIDGYENVIHGKIKENKEKELSDENYRLFKMEENAKWNAHWENQSKEADENIAKLSRVNEKENLQQQIDTITNEIEELSNKGAGLRAEIESTEGLQSLQDGDKDETKPIVVPDHKTEVENIQKEYDSLALRKAAAQREIIRQKALKEVAETATIFLNSLEE